MYIGYWNTRLLGESINTKVGESDIPTIPVKHVELVPDGAYDGKIVKTEIVNRKAGEKNVQYYDMHVSLGQFPKADLRYGVNYSVSDRSSLGKLLEKFGADLSVNEIDPDVFLLNKACKILLKQEEIKGKKAGETFTVNRVVSLEPIKAEPKKK